MDNIHPEDKKVLELILDHLLSEIEYLSKFRSDYDEDYEDIDEYEDEDDEESKYTIKGRLRSYKLHYSNNDNKRQQSVSLTFTPIFGTVSISTSECYQNRDIKVGWGPANKDIKIKFMKLWHTVNQWEAVEIPRQEREKFINGVMKVFPSIFDNMILGGEDDEDKKD